MRLRTAAILAGALAARLSLAAEAPPAGQSPADAFMATLKPQKGEVQLPGGLATLKLPESFRYLSPADAQKLLEQAWGNPPGSGANTLGMLYPAAVSPVTAGGWGVVITYNDDGHVSDDDANKIDYADLLKDMKAATAKANEERSKKGYRTVDLVGWAEPPHYDGASHKIYWAKDLAFGSGTKHTLNYFVRVLGRQGVLELNAVAGMEQLAMVRDSMKQVEGFTDFTPGNRYADYNSGTDKLAAYGLAALVAGGVAAKTGLLAKLLALLIAAKKLVFVAVAGVAAAVGKAFKKKPASPAA